MGDLRAVVSLAFAWMTAFKASSFCCYHGNLECDGQTGWIGIDTYGIRHGLALLGQFGMQKRVARMQKRDEMSNRASWNACIEKKPSIDFGGKEN